MSRGARWLLGAFALIFALTFVVSAQNASANARLLLCSVMAFCLLIAVACFSARLRGVAVRVIGALVFLAYTSYLVSELIAAHHAQESHWIRAAIGLAVFGLAGLYVTIWGKYPAWGYGSKAFGAHQENESDN
jgi:hypothetical protein